MILDRRRRDEDLVGAGEAAAVLREEGDALRSQEFELGPSRPWSSIRSEPATVAPWPRTIIASGIMPLPPMPEKK